MEFYVTSVKETLNHIFVLHTRMFIYNIYHIIDMCIILKGESEKDTVRKNFILI